MKKNIWRLWPLLLIIPVLIVGGCSWLDQLQAWKNGGESAEQTQINEENGQNENAQDENAQEENAEEETISPDIETREVVLYFADSNGSGLKKENRVIPKNEGVAKDVINELIKGPDDSSLFPTLPASAILQDINIKDGVCIVDFNGEFLSDSLDGSIDEELMIFSLVDSLTQFPTITEVKILVDGKEQNMMMGGIDLSQNISRK